MSTASGRKYFYMTTFELCGLEIGHLAAADIITIIASVCKDDNRDQSKNSEIVSTNGDTDFQFWRNMLLNVADSVPDTCRRIGCFVFYSM
jgi:hypothetical protein